MIYVIWSYLSNPDYGIAVKIKDVAEVFETQKPVQVFSRLNGQPAIGLSIKKQSDANAVEISDQVISCVNES